MTGAEECTVIDLSFVRARVMLFYKIMTQHEKILDLLSSGNWVCTSKMYAEFIADPRTRIAELKKKGHNLEWRWCKTHNFHDGGSKEWRILPQEDDNYGYSLENPRLKGGDKGYKELHDWVRNQLGTPFLCSRCGTTTAKVYNWANKTGAYKRELYDWLRLCKKCHNSYDGVSVKGNPKRIKTLAIKSGRIAQESAPSNDFCPYCKYWLNHSPLCPTLQPVKEENKLF